jgi:hypothetical protein
MTDRKPAAWAVVTGKSIFYGGVIGIGLLMAAAARWLFDFAPIVFTVPTVRDLVIAGVLLLLPATVVAVALWMFDATKGDKP